MAEAPVTEETLPPKGRVRAVRNQWSVHEDGALAYNVQQQEIDEHYGLNRFHRRTVRGDIPIAKIVQTEEELQQQEERMRELQALHVQAEEDERLARQVSKRLQRAAQDEEVVRELDDEEIARQLQEKEKRKYERHLEKKREKMLREERRLLEASLARESEEARLALNSDNGSARLGDSVESLDAQGAAKRVTPGGRIEDGGDFSDFYKLPDELDELARMEIQANQDEELARLLQEQEHKRSGAEVDQDRLRQIEQQDERLARVMQEQEKIRLKKARQKHKEKKEAQRLKQLEQLPLGASANTMNQQQHQQQDDPHYEQQHQRLHQYSPETSRPHSGEQPDSASGSGTSPAVAIPDRHTRYRRNSYTQAFDSPPSPPRSQPPPLSPPSPPRSQPPPRQRRDNSNVNNNNNNTKSIPQFSSQTSSLTGQPAPASIQSASKSSLPHYHSEGMSTLESARRIAAGDPDRIKALQQESNLSGSRQHQQRAQASYTSTIDIVRGHHSEPVTYSQPYQPQAQLELRNGQDADPGRYAQQGQGQRYNNRYSSEEDDFHAQEDYGGGSGYNIAAAIDPTYQRRHPELAATAAEAQPAPVIPFSRSLPQADGELEWDPGLRGSLRKTRAPIHLQQDSTTSSMGQGGMDPVMSSWQPVQGQRRGDGTKQGKSHGDSGKKDKSNCKQQ